MKILLGALLIAAAAAIGGPVEIGGPGAIGGPVNPHDRRETIGGAYDRSLGAMEFWNRETNLQRENYGARGRINGLRDNARESEVPRNFQPGYLGSY